MADINDIKAKVRSVLVDSPVLEGMDPADIQNDTPLAETLGLDSVDALELVIGMEKVFGIKVDASGLDRENFRSIDTLAKYIQEQLAAASS